MVTLNKYCLTCVVILLACSCVQSKVIKKATWSKRETKEDTAVSPTGQLNQELMLSVLRHLNLSISPMIKDSGCQLDYSCALGTTLQKQLSFESLRKQMKAQCQEVLLVETETDSEEDVLYGIINYCFHLLPIVGEVFSKDHDPRKSEVQKYCPAVNKIVVQNLRFLQWMIAQAANLEVAEILDRIAIDQAEEKLRKGQSVAEAFTSSGDSKNDGVSRDLSTTKYLLESLKPFVVAFSMGAVVTLMLTIMICGCVKRTNRSSLSQMHQLSAV